MAEDKNVLAIFVDVRGFTKWAEANEVFINLGAFIEGFLQILHTRFPSPKYQIKPLGDGAMLVSEIKEGASPDAITRLLSQLLTTVKRVEADFKGHCRSFAGRVGHTADLTLGWGIVRGKVIKVGDDWAGHNLNKCSRLCGEARPFGIVIDRDDFPQLPRTATGLAPQIRKLRGVGDVPVWVSVEIASQFITRERLRETPEVHVAGTCFYEERPGELMLLFARRSLSRRLFPGKLEGCGGQLANSETFAEGIRRHFRQEFGLDVDVLADIHNFYEIREPNEPVIPGIRFLCRRVGNNQPWSANHSEVQWISEAEFRNMPSDDFTGDLKHSLISLLDKYKAARN
ncbi:NUDIX domain-containing protein [Actinoplanes sp. ATCC 53533]|uniref:NUDIX domain-containing protein n=1 Tax=Actinoplanes sp. ATCC 53533 TaxID=1288362 RepID=UPI000F7791E7|nr:NUDIX domain-containing protein [Actinoplanes sp. ATCC 53533]